MEDSEERIDVPSASVDNTLVRKWSVAEMSSMRKAERQAYGSYSKLYKVAPEVVSLDIFFLQLEGYPLEWLIVSGEGGSKEIN